MFYLTLINSVAFQPIAHYQSYHYTLPQNNQYIYCNCEGKSEKCRPSQCVTIPQKILDTFLRVV
jgi:hypothetical protein